MSSCYQAKQKLVNFLNKSKSIKDSTFTHTSITEPAGSFYIQTKDLDNFHELYKNAMRQGCSLYLTEKHKDISPVLIDFDFRFMNTEDLTRRYDDQIIEKVVELYIKKMSDYVILPDEINVLVMEKESPIYDEKKKCVKDGIHIVMPNVVSRPSVQYIVRNDLLKEYEDILKTIKADNSVSDIFDECVIHKNNWQMYGSKKPNSTSYKITKNWVYKNGEKESKDLLEDHEYVEILSIRNKYVETPITEDNSKRKKIEAYDHELKKINDKKENKKKLHKKIIQTNESTFEPTCDELELVKKLINILDDSRANNYGNWIRLGWCLRNIHIELLSNWDEFSKRSTKYELGVCDRLWYRMREGGLGIGTLHMWAKQDNQTEYTKIVSEDISSLIYKSLSLTDYDIALVIARMFKHRYRCASHKHHVWYEFKNNGWKEIEKGYTLFYKEIPTVLFNEYMKIINKESIRAQNSVDERDRKICTDNIENLTKISKKLKNTSFVKDKMYKECSGLFYEPGFEDRLDSNPYLIGFENGVFDLENNEFREGRPEDYVSLSTGINYIEYNEDNPYIEQVMDFMAKVLTNENVREFVLLLFASILDGTNRDEKFHVWTGSGSNGKSKIVELFQQTIGEYACIFNVSLLTQKRIGSNQTNSELAIAKGKRFAVLQEPEENEKLNIGIMKEITGGDKIQCRCLFKEPIRFKPMFKPILICNHMPLIPSDDGASWRRVCRVEYTSKFVDDPSDDNPNEFPIDRELSYRFESWKETFMAILLHKYYVKYKECGKIQVPKEVMDYTNEYQRKNDIFAEFCDTYIESDSGGTVDIGQLFEKFKEYCSVDSMRIPKKSVFQEAMEKRYGKLVVHKGAKYLKGINIKNRMINEE